MSAAGFGTLVARSPVIFGPPFSPTWGYARRPWAGMAPEAVETQCSVLHTILGRASVTPEVAARRNTAKPGGRARELLLTLACPNDETPSLGNAGRCFPAYGRGPGRLAVMVAAVVSSTLAPHEEAVACTAHRAWRPYRSRFPIDVAPAFPRSDEGWMRTVTPFRSALSSAEAYYVKLHELCATPWCPR